MNGGKFGYNSLLMPFRGQNSAKRCTFQNGQGTTFSNDEHREIRGQKIYIDIGGYICDQFGGNVLPVFDVSGIGGVSFFLCFFFL